MEVITTKGAKDRKVTPEEIRLSKIESTVRFRVFSPSFDQVYLVQKDIDGQVIKIPTGQIRQMSVGKTLCDVFHYNQLDGRRIPLPDAEPYAVGEGTDTNSALADALNKAEKTEKPLTPAQRADRKAADTRIAELEAQLAAKNNTDSATEVGAVDKGAGVPDGNVATNGPTRTEETTKRRGRPPGSKNKKPDVPVDGVTTEAPRVTFEPAGA